ncbi:glycosyltransferase [Actinosynnema pretiosum subsp. pretiosum]|uniref:4,4'-diaponeurosporenoate glycosyltransferase n=2 Tax=Actinosynnema TaxID=40566 RepID=C6WMH7_ACTMD|nr:glycosyltransferase [Actinosynnema mirum]ACU36506.1 glycosyl transferase family 2 [Actinosynnema mirum DSM 43827]AXX29962.1 Glycosyl transferase, group 2 family protein [Actinosynnema pretiosum subsp. pretiosum]QUF05852.1 glycosyltransferase [Actinosynnema pretiosum subsp. pretiosum]
MIEAVGVVVPARDEAGTVGDAVRAALRALEACPVRSVVCVVADRCADDTAGLARAAGAVVLEQRAELALGQVRDLGTRHALALLGGDPARTWLLGSDADSVVGPDWVTRHLAHAAEGADVVTGRVEVVGLEAELSRRYRGFLARETRTPVHGADFGVRGSAFLAVGGYRPLSSGEDRDLWWRLVAAGFRAAQSTDVVVRTSGRVVGRARGGVADLLADLRAGAEEVG